MKKMVKGIVVVLVLFLINPAGLFAWSSEKSSSKMDTHKLIAEQAVTILQNDSDGSESTEFVDNLQILYDNIDKLKEGAVWPDFDPDGYSLYQEHFYDPDTGRNFTNGTIDETAETQIRLFVAIALHEWKNGNYSTAAFELGTAMHYFADANEPHHASNQIAGLGYAHSSFESWMEDVKYEYAIDTAGVTTTDDFYTGALTSETYLSDFLASSTYETASAAKDVVGFAQHNSSWDDWEFAGEQCMTNAQVNMAQLLYRFLQEVSNDYTKSTPDAIGKFHVVIKVADTYEAGTDDYVYFGMKLNDGRTLEFECNVEGNDFSKGLRWGYEFKINDESFTAADITKVWIKKKDYTWLGDDLKIKYIQIYMKGKNVLDKTINDWIGKGGAWGSKVYYNISVDGFTY